jgi:alpha-D-ribose 1-methylphosphonate 5-triphosphate synthase subunit PhnG
LISRRRRTEILIEGPSRLALDLTAFIVKRHEVIEVIPPRQGLVMNQARETARNSRFYLGEALMTEARVRIEGAVGIGMVLGDAEDIAFDLAVIDAAFVLPIPEVERMEIERRLIEAERVLDMRRAERAAAILASKVDFTTMSGQDISAQEVV